MNLTVLGSGTCVPSLKRNASGYYLKELDCRILIDCGAGTLHQFIKAGINYRDIDALFITHRHPDHSAGLLPLVHALIATPGYKREKALSIIGHSLFIEYYDMAVRSVLGDPDSFSVKLIEAGIGLDFGPFHITTAKTKHSGDSIAYRFEAGGRSVVFTGDADHDPEIIELSREADLLIADCSFPDSMKVNGHMSAGECGLLAEEAGVKKLVLSHIYPADRPDSERVEESRKNFGGEILLAEDLLEIEV